MRLDVFVGKLGVLLFGYLVKGDIEHGIFAAEIIRLIILGEFYVDVLVLADLHSDDRVLEAGDKRAAAEHEVIVLRSAAGELFAVYAAREVDVYGVAVFARPVRDLDVGRVLFEKLLHFVFHVGIGYIIFKLFDF